MYKQFFIFIMLISSLLSSAQELPRGVYNNCLDQIVADSKEGNLLLHRSTISLLKDYEIDYFADRKLRSLLDPASEIYNSRNERIINKFYQELEEQNPDIQIGIVFDNLDVDDLNETGSVYLPTNLKCKRSELPVISIADLNEMMNPNRELVGAQDLVLAEALKSFVRIFAPEYMNSQGGSTFKNNTAKLDVTQMLDYVSVHHEYWKAEQEMEAFYAHLTLLAGLNSIICYLDLDIKIEVFNTLRTLDEKSKEDQADLIDPLVDRVLLNSSFKAVSAALDRYCNYVEAWGQNGSKTVIWPVFNASGQGLAEMDCYGSPSNTIMRSQGFADDLESSSLKSVESKYLYTYRLAEMNGFTSNGAGESKCGSPSFPHWSPGDVELNGFMWLDLADIAGRNIPLGEWLEPELVTEEREIIKEEPRPIDDEKPVVIEKEVETPSPESQAEQNLEKEEEPVFIEEEQTKAEKIVEELFQDQPETTEAKEKDKVLVISKDQAQVALDESSKQILLNFPSGVEAVAVEIEDLEGHVVMKGLALCTDGKGKFSLYGLKNGNYTAKAKYLDVTWETKVSLK